MVLVVLAVVLAVILTIVLLLLFGAFVHSGIQWLEKQWDKWLNI